MGATVLEHAHLSEAVMNLWNTLPKDVVMGDFQRRLDRFIEGKFFVTFFPLSLSLKFSAVLEMTLCDSAAKFKVTPYLFER